MSAGQLAGAPTLDELVAQVQNWANEMRFRDEPYSADVFTASAGVWTVKKGNVTMMAYSVIQNVMALQLLVVSTSTDANIGNALYVRIPGGYRALGHGQSGFAHWNYPGTADVGLVTTLSYPNDYKLNIVRRELGATTFPASRTRDFNVRLMMTFGVYKL